MKKIKTNITDTGYWDKGAEIYNEIVNNELQSEKNQAWRGLLKRFLPEKEKLRVLDVGTGPGFFSILLAEAGHHVTAIDSSEEMIKVAKENAAAAKVEVQFILTDILKYEPEDKFDVIISRNVTWFLRKPLRTYADWFDMLAADGTLIIFDANHTFYLTNPYHNRLHQLAKQEAVAKGYIAYRSIAEVDEGDELALSLPLSYVYRPDWDVKALKMVGFKKIEVDQGFDHLVLSETEQCLYQYHPMFAITAKK